MNLPLIKRIDFKYNNLMHSAVVSISGTSEEMFVHLQLINSFLRKIFEIEHIRFSTRNGQILVKENSYHFLSEIAGLLSLELKLDSEDKSLPAMRIV